MPSNRQALEFSSCAIEVVGWGLTTLALAFYILADPSSTQAALYAIVPRRFHIRLARIMLNLETIVGGYMRGQMITSVLMGLFAYALLRACSVKNPLPLGGLCWDHRRAAALSAASSARCRWWQRRSRAGRSSSWWSSSRSPPTRRSRTGSHSARLWPRAAVTGVGYDHRAAGGAPS